MSQLANDRQTVKVTQETIRLLRRICAFTTEHQYMVLERLVREEYGQVLRMCLKESDEDQS